jgi:hypothetical protein
LAHTQVIGVTVPSNDQLQELAVRLAIAAPAAVLLFFVCITLGRVVAYPPWLFAEVVLGIPAASLVLAIGSLVLAAASLRGGVTSGRLAILGAALIETLWTALLLSANFNDLVCDHPCLIPYRPPGL